MSLVVDHRFLLKTNSSLRSRPPGKLTSKEREIYCEGTDESDETGMTSYYCQERPGPAMAVRSSSQGMQHTMRLVLTLAAIVKSVV